MSFTPTQINPKPARRRWFKIILLTLGLIIVTGIVFIYFASQDLKTVDDADLIPEPVVLLMEDDNAYYVLPVIAELSESQRVIVDQAVAVASGRSSSSAQQAVNNTMFLTDAFITASKKKGYQCPTSVNRYSMNVELCSLNDLRDLAELTVLRAEVALAAGDITDATQSSLAIVRMAYYQSNSATTMIEQLVAMAMYNNALATLENVLIETDNRKLLLGEIKEYQPSAAVLVDLYRADYLGFKNEILTMTNGTSIALEEAIPVGYRWQPNRTTQEMADFYRLLIESNVDTCVVADRESDSELLERAEKMSHISPFIRVQPNVVGKILTALMVASFSDIQSNVCEAEQKYVSLIENLRE